MLELNYHHLYYFFSVVKAGSITNASADLLLSPPTISAQIKKFEKRVKRKLFEKKGQGLRLTPEGRVFFDYARQIFALGDQLQDRIRDNTLDGIPGIQFGVTPGMPAAFIEALINFVRKQEPKSPLSVEKQELEKLLPMMGDRRVDLTLTTQPIRHAPAFHFENIAIGEFPLMIVARAGRYASFLNPKGLKKLPFIVAATPKRSSLDIKNYIELIGSRVMCEVGDRDDALRLAAQGHGVTIVDSFSFQRSPFRRQMKTFTAPVELNLREHVYLASIPRKLKNPLAEKVLTSFRLH